MSLRLSLLTLSQFRSHRRVDLVFDGRPVVLYGDNGTGKTNLLEAISLLSPGRGLRRAAPEELGAQPQGLGWKIGAEIESSGVLHEVETGAAQGQTRSVRIDGKAAAQSALGRLAPMVWLTPAMDRLWIEGAEGRRRFLDRLVLAFHPEHAEAALAYDKAMRERNRLLREGIADAHWYGALEEQMGEAGARVTGARHAALERLARARDPDSPFPEPHLAIADDSPEDLALALAEGRRRDMAAGRTMIGPHRADLSALWVERGRPAAQCSTGEQKALLISTLLAHARALHAQIGHAPLLLLDEVAAHLDDGRRAALYDALCALGAQPFLTGTGPELFTSLGARAQTFRLSETAGQSQLTEVDP